MHHNPVNLGGNSALYASAQSGGNYRGGLPNIAEMKGGKLYHFLMGAFKDAKQNKNVQYQQTKTKRNKAYFRQRKTRGRRSSRSIYHHN